MPARRKPTLREQFTPRQITEEEVARYGHIAGTLRLYLQTFGLRPADFAKIIYADEHKRGANVYPWVNGYQAPPRSRRQQLAALMGVPVRYVTPRELDDPPPPALPSPKALRPPPGREKPVTTEPQRTELVVREPWAPAAPEVMRRFRAPAAAASNKPLSYIVHDDGTATITINVTLSNEQAEPLVRLLMDSGITKLAVRQGDDDG